MPGVRLSGVSRAYDSFWAVKNVDLTVAEGEFVSLLGPSGCGKTTTLRMVAGFIFPTSGRIFIGDEDCTTVPPNKRNIGMVFQSYALFPHLTVAQNVGFGLKMRSIGGKEASQRVGEALRLVRLDEMANRYPRQLSGGQQQRVALARAIVINPRVLLMDEPLGALDLKLRQELQIQIRKVQREVGITTLYVTHDQGEALSLSDRVAVMRDGEIIQLDTPEKLYSAPETAFVANFVGRTNLLPVEVVGKDNGFYKTRLKSSAGAEFLVPVQANRPEPTPGKNYLLGFRPERAHLAPSATNKLSVRVDDVRYFGPIRSVALTAPHGPMEIDLGADAPALRAQDQITVGWEPAASFLVAADD
ncbi:MAG: ABC transporter ATP-binding protein [Pseudorhodoplanes sp.]